MGQRKVSLEQKENGEEAATLSGRSNFRAEGGRELGERTSHIVSN